MKRRKVEAPSSSPRLVSSAGRATLDVVIRFCAVGRRLSGGRNVLRSGVLHDFLGELYLVGSVAMDGQENSALLNAAFVPFRFILGNSHPD